MEGRDYIVAPMVMMVEGVHKGSRGAMYYPEDELAKNHQVWNHKPVVVYHPTMNGQGVSACDPAIIDINKVGVIMNTRWDAKTKKLRAEAWMEPDRLSKVDDRVLPALENNQMMEVSTGVFTDKEVSSGEWNGEEYDAIARNHGPDHLAILPDKIGACSIEDGGGLLQMNEAQDEVVQNVTAALQGAEEALREARTMAVNVLSSSNISAALFTAIRSKFGEETWIADFYPTENFLIYEAAEGKLFRVSYTIASDDTVSLSDETPVEVMRVTEYRTVDGGQFVGNQTTSQGDDTMEKKELVDNIISADGSAFKETDRDRLMGLDDDVLQGLQPVANTGQQTPVPETNQEELDKATQEGASGLTQNQQAPPQLSAEDQAVLNFGRSQLAAQKKKAIQTITANEACPFTPEELDKKDLGELQKIAALVGNDQQRQEDGFETSWVGANTPPTGNTSLEGNEEQEEAYTSPAMF